MDIEDYILKDITDGYAYLVSSNIKELKDLTVEKIHTINESLILNEETLIIKNYFYNFKEKYWNTIWKSDIKNKDYLLFDKIKWDKYLKINNELDKFIVKISNGKIINLNWNQISIYPFISNNDVSSENIVFNYYIEMKISEIWNLIKEICLKKYNLSIICCYPISKEEIGKKFNMEKSDKFNLNKYKSKSFKNFKMDDVNIVVLLKNNEVSSKNGLVGLKNLGNTCYMNSAIQVLLHIPIIYKYFLNKNYKYDVNINNPLAYKGKLAKKFYKLCKYIWKQNDDFISPHYFKKFISNCNPMFEGNEQHDSSEFLSYLIDNLHEELNLILKKPVTEKIESEDINVNDNEVGRKSWLTHLKRNYSFINSLFYGQYKSTIKCPECKKISITYDPFQMVYLPIPKNIKRKFNLFVYDEDNLNSKNYFKIKISGDSNLVNNYKIIKIKEAICEKLNLNINEYKIINNDNQEELLESKLCFYEVNAQNIDLSIIKINNNNILNEENLKNDYITVQLYLEKMISFIWHFDIEDTLEKLVNRIFDLYKNHFKVNLRTNIDQIKNEFWSSLDPDNFIKLKIYYSKINITKDSKIKDLIIIKNNLEKKHGLNVLDTLHSIKYKNQVKIQVTFSDKFSRKCNLDNYIRSFKSEKFEINLKKTENILDSKNNNILELFKKFSYPEKLDKNNTWYCSKCKKHMEATKILQLFKWPSILIIVMKKLKDNNEIVQKDTENSIDFPFDLNMDNFVLNKESLDGYNIKLDEITTDNINKINENIKKDGLDYELTGVINHVGNFAIGHYYSYIKQDNKWYNFNDSKVNQMSKLSVITKHAYVLVYKKKNW